MKKTIIILTLTALFISCNPTPNKEERLQKLETEIQLTLDKVEVLENRIKTLEMDNRQFERRFKTQETGIKN